MNITIYDVAREAGVSMATVSRVINGNPNVKPSTRKKVLVQVERLGYRPNAVARGLASKKTTTVGVITPDISSMFFAELARGIDDIANMYKYNIILSNSDQDLNREIKLINTMLEKQVDGIVYMGGQIKEEHLAQFKTSPVPIVLAASIDPTGTTSSVNIDFEAAGYEATQLLIENGHTKSAFVMGEEESTINELKYRGFLRAHEEAGLPFDEDYLYRGDFTYNSGMAAITKFIELDQKPTAIFAATDEISLGVIHGAQDRGIKVPEDVEVIGFDNTKLATMVRPTLSTVVQPMYDIGAVAMRLLTKYMKKEEVEESHVILPYQIIERNSTIQK